MLSLLKLTLPSAGDKSISHITCTAHMAYFLIPQATRAGYLWAYDIALTFPALTLQSCVIWWNATPQSPLFVWIQEPVECIGFLPQGIRTLETWSYLHRLASPAFPLPLFSIQQNSTRGLLDLLRLIAQLTCAHIFWRTSHNRGRCEWKFRATGLFSVRLPPPLCHSPGQSINAIRSDGLCPNDCRY